MLAPPDAGLGAPAPTDWPLSAAGKHASRIVTARKRTRCNDDLQLHLAIAGLAAGSLAPMPAVS